MFLKSFWKVSNNDSEGRQDCGVHQNEDSIESYEQDLGLSLASYEGRFGVALHQVLESAHLEDEEVEYCQGNSRTDRESQVRPVFLVPVERQSCEFADHEDRNQGHLSDVEAHANRDQQPRCQETGDSEDDYRDVLV